MSGFEDMPGKLDELVVNFLCRALPGLVAGYRFGSAGTAYQRPESDVDIAFLAASPIADVERWELAQALAAPLRQDVDLVDLKKASTVLRMQVVAHDERIYCADENRAGRFEAVCYACTICR